MQPLKAYAVFQPRISKAGYYSATHLLLKCSIQHTEELLKNIVTFTNILKGANNPCNWENVPIGCGSNKI